MHLLGIRQSVRNRVRNNLEERMCKGILKIVDVWFKLDARDTVDRLGAELNLLETARRPRMEQARRCFGREFSLSCSLSNLIDEDLVGKSKESILRQRGAPFNFLEIVEWSFRGKLNGLHCGCKVK
jgi:hypothetical protein